MANQIFPAKTSEPEPQLGELLSGIGKDVRRIAVDEMELARGKMTSFLENLVLKAAGIIVGGCVAFIGLGFLCLAAVFALEPVIHPMWLRLIIMGVVYAGVGGALAMVFAKRIAALRGPDLAKQIEEVGETMDAVKNGLEHS